MAIKKQAPVQELPSVDEAVQAAVGADPVYGKLSKARRTESQKKKAQRDAERNKVTYDLPVELTNQIDSIAVDEGIPASHLVALLALIGLEALERGEISIKDRKTPSRVPRFSWFLDIDDFLGNLRQRIRQR